MAAARNDRMTDLQGAIAIASFSAGTLIAMVCLFFIEPKGEISNSGIMVVSQFLIMCGGLLGLKLNYDTKFQRYGSKLDDVREEMMEALEAKANKRRKKSTENENDVDKEQ